MAEAVISAVVERLANLLIGEVIFLKGVRAEFERLQKELVSIQGFLKTVDSIHNQDPSFRIWVADVRDVAYDVEDIIDNFLLPEEGINNFFKRCARKLRNIFKLHRSGVDLKEIFSKLDDISERRKRYDTTNVRERTISSNTSELLLRRSYPHQRDDDIIGLEVQKNRLMAELSKEEDRFCVVSIYGMGGSGKTTLAKEVYNHQNIKSHFDSYAWTSISQQMNARAVLQEILRKVGNTPSLETGSMQEVELVEKIHAILEGKRYLVVLDDIWNTKDWDVLEPAFPKRKGSKIMFTTRNKEVAEHADRWSYHCEPRSLTDDEAWELLCKKAFPPNVADSRCFFSSDKEKCGRAMVKKCGGLPLAIVVLGGLLASKRSLDEWETVSKQIETIGMRNGKDDDVVLSILSLSYIELPYHLKPLFLYLGLFPEDSNIPVKKVVHMLIAENLIIGQDGETIEEVGRHYLDELIHRCMVQIGQKSLGGERVKTCRLHDKMRDLCIDIGKKENFFEVISHQSSKPSSSSAPCSKLRRCSIYIEEIGKEYVFPKHITPCLRTVFFNVNRLFPNIVYKDFKLLKVLEIQGGVYSEEFYEVLMKLRNLRYLRVYGDGVIKLKSNVMHQLRHVYGGQITLSKIDKMTGLQTLSYVNAGPWMTDLLKLTNLEKLGIRVLHENTSRLLTIAIGGGLDKLRSLTVLGNDELSSDLLEAISMKHRLQKLSLNLIKVNKFPSQFPSNLIKLSLDLGFSENLLEDPMPTLEKLLHLLSLELRYSYYGKQMVCSAKGFPKLKHLKICYFHPLEEWTVEKGAMTCLTTCEICYCEKLKMVPQGFRFLTRLQELKINGMPKSFEERVKEGGEDWETVKHIPSITTVKN
ncbi:hypothetical protein AQUCO_05500036v1 [Aquilegia coerulea]|uniref:AAA+ ATPase domain-containing protein n=1 Tax=Aquilegia coerulea TaxID=218851 RepID=A0A2G5CGW7_AQUCA|nr:hypothetical protein AQUCO_05500036v1 [Aquilegia coerulea]